MLGWPIKDDTNAYLFSPNSDERVCVAKELKIGTLRNEALNIFGEGLLQLFILFVVFAIFLNTDSDFYATDF